MSQLEYLCQLEAVRDILLSVSLGQALVLLLMLEGHSQVEVAEFMGVSREAVRKRLDSARDTLAAQPEYQAWASDPERKRYHSYRSGPSD